MGDFGRGYLPPDLEFRRDVFIFDKKQIKIHIAKTLRCHFAKHIMTGVNTKLITCHRIQFRGDFSIVG